MLVAGNEDILLVAENRVGQVVGYGLGGLNPDESLHYDSELIALHIRKEFQRQNIGTQLFAAVCAGLQERGCQSVFLWVLEDNTAYRFYQKLGGQQFSRKPWNNNAYFETDIWEIAYGWPVIQKIVEFSILTSLTSWNH